MAGDKKTDNGEKTPKRAGLLLLIGSKGGKISYEQLYRRIDPGVSPLYGIGDIVKYAREGIIIEDGENVCLSEKGEQDYKKLLSIEEKINGKQ